MDKLTAMATFVKVVETRSFTLAAKILELPKARVSQRIADLERVLEVRLINRTTRTLSLTEEGKSYYERCLHILHELGDIEGTLRLKKTNPKGKVRVEILAAISQHVIVPNLHEFKDKFPDISLRIGCSNRISNLYEEDIDCAIRGGTLVDSSLVAKNVCNVHFGLYASPGYLNASPPINTPDDLAAHRKINWFFSESHRPLIWQLNLADKNIEVPGPYDLLFDESELAISACVAGAGICPGAPFVVASRVASGELCPVLPQWCFPPRQINIIYPSNKYLPIRVRSFLDWAFDVLKTNDTLNLMPRDLTH